jgi:DNA-binding NtrC family response regulator
LVCATDRDLRLEVAGGRFNEELLYKLEIIPLALPPLRERDDDVLRIGRRLLRRIAAEEGKHFSDFTADAEAAILAYSWPGNARELANVLRGVVVLNDAENVSAAMLPQTMAVAAVDLPLCTGIDLPQPAKSHTGIEPLDKIVRRTIEEAIARSDGNIPKAAAALQVTPASLYRRLQGWQDEASVG